MAETAVAHADVLAVFERGDPSAPLTAPEVAEAVGCARRTAHKKLAELAEEGTLETKKVGARGRVWWRPRPRRAGTEAGQGGDRSQTGTDWPDPDDQLDPGGDGRGAGRALRELHDASRELMRAERRERICEVAVTAAESILGLSLCGLWLHDPEENALEPVAWTESGVEEYGEPPPFPVGDSLVGRAFREGTYRKYDDITTEQEVYDPDTSVRSELILPLGGHGVLNASSPEPGVFDEVDVSLGRILAANVETALDRADRLAERRARRRELRRQRDELETLNRINALVEDTIDALVGAATRAEIEATVCERLADSGFYVDAWVVERGPHGGVARRAGGDDRDQPDDGLADASDASNPIVTAIEDRTVTVVPRIDDHGQVPGRFRDAAERAGARACLVVPLTYADTAFGALVVHAPEPDEFSDREVTAFETLGRVVGFAINATNNRQLLLGTTAVELETLVRDADAWFLSAARRLDATVAVRGVVPTGDDALIEYATVEGTDEGVAVPEQVADLPAVADVRVLSSDDDSWFLECTVRETDALGAVVEYGATVRTARADAAAGRVVARFPSSTSARDALAIMEDAFPSAELVAKRVVDLSDRSVATIRQTVADRLTDRQLTALRAAFLAGYYDSPRGTTARELADSLDVAPSTLHQHLQAASRKLLATVFDET